MIKKTLLLLIALGMYSTSVLAGWSSQWAECEYLPGRMLVKMNSSIERLPFRVNESGIVETSHPELNALLEEFEVTGAFKLVPDKLLDKLKIPAQAYDVYVLEFRDEYPVLEVVEQFQASEFIELAEPDLIRRESRAPNDPMWFNQWDKRLVGADFAWDVTTGDPSIICAGIDSGVDYDHDDLRPVLWVNPGEDLDNDHSTGDWDDYPGDTDDLNGVDDDDNGYEDDFLGWDFIRNIGGCVTGEDCDNMEDNDMFGMNSHGTHVAGIMAADGDNGIGMSGMVWDGTLMALRAGYEPEQGEGAIPQSASVPAIYYAVAMGAKIINMSYGGPGTSGVASAAMTDAWNNGAILFAASGNDGSTSSDNYPANYADVIAVNATDNNDHLAGFSNRGPWTDICAPGVSVLGTVIGDLYQPWDGTSMASPSAAGVAALVWSAFPNMTNAELRDLLFDTAVDITSQNSGTPASHLGHGRVSAREAMAANYPRLSVTTVAVSDFASGDGDGRIEANESAELIFYIHNMPEWAGIENLSVDIAVDDSRLNLSNGELNFASVASGETVNNTDSPVTMSIGNFDRAFWATLSLTYSAPNGFQGVDEYALRIGRGRVLVVDDDDGADYQHYYLDDAAAFDYNPDLWSATLDGTVSAAEMAEYEAVIWSCGNDESSTLSPSDREELATYLDGGGKLLLIGQGIDEHLSGLGDGFYADYLHAASDGGQEGSRLLDGVDGTFTADMSLLLQGGNCAGNGSLGPSRILPVGGAEAVFTYNSGGIGGVHYSGSYSVVYFAFALEAGCGLSNTTHQAEVVAGALAAMDVISDTPEETPTAALPSEVTLHGNYPNPFNPTTTIRFDLASTLNVKLSVFDILGREVATLLNGRVQAGSHSVLFDGSGLASGLYLVRLQTAGELQTSKMMLLK